MRKYASYPNEKDLKQKLGALCFNYELVDCLFTVFKYQFSGKMIVKGADGSSFQPSKQKIGLNAQHRQKETYDVK